MTTERADHGQAEAPGAGELLALLGVAGERGLIGDAGEHVGAWDAVDLDDAVVQVLRVAVEVNGHVSIQPYPTSKRSRRTIPLPPFTVQLLRAHARRFPTGATGEVFTNAAGGPMRRSLFRQRIWRPSLVRAGLLGKVVAVDDGGPGPLPGGVDRQQRARAQSRGRN